MIDSQANDITLNLPLVHDPALGSMPDGGLTKYGAGELILTVANSYTGNTDVEDGTLEAWTSDAIPYGTGLIVGTNGTVDLGDPNGAGSSVVVTSSVAAPHAGGVAAVPEPGTLALLAVAVWSAAIYCRFRRRSKAGLTI